jgi:ferrous iron transport protein B
MSQSTTPATGNPAETPARPAVVAVIGNPNTGKSTLFVELTGARQRIGNFPGVTVEKKSGYATIGRRDVEFVDLPGTYSLSAFSPDEMIAVEVLSGMGPGTPLPDAVLVVLDATNLRRALFLATQLVGLGIPVVVAVNMWDVAQRRGISIDIEALGEHLGAQVVPTVGSKAEGIDDLRVALDRALSGSATPPPGIPVWPALDEAVDRLTDAERDRGRPIPRYIIERGLVDVGAAAEKRLWGLASDDLRAEVEAARDALAPDAPIGAVEARERYAWIGRVLADVESRAEAGPTWTDRLDAVLLHPISGSIIFVLLMGVIFQAVFAWAGPLMDLIDGGFGALAGATRDALGPGTFVDFLADGVIGGVGAVIIFLPQIAFLFIAIQILEDSGYMTRVAFLADRWMRMLGLSGQSFIPLLSSFACAIPGIMATRSIPDPRVRHTTVLIAPFMSCSARLPVYVLLIGAFVPDERLLGGWLGLQGLVMLSMYLLGVVVGLVVAWVLKRFVFRGDSPSFIMEMPDYKRPRFKAVAQRVWERSRTFLITAGTLIFAVAVIVWILTNVPRPASIGQEYDAQRAWVAAGATAESPDDEAFAEALDDWIDRRDLDAATAGVQKQMVLDAWRAAKAGAASDATGEVLAPLPNDSPLRTQLADAMAAWRDPDAPVVEKAEPEPAVAEPVEDGEGPPPTRLEAALADLDNAEAQAYLEQSVLGTIGRAVAPIFHPLGWDWRVTVATLASFPAREVVIAVMGTTFAVGEVDEESPSLRNTMATAEWPDGRPLFTLPMALGLLVFFALCLQCGATVAAIKRELNSYSWAAIAWLYSTALGYLGALAVYQIGTAAGL